MSEKARWRDGRRASLYPLGPVTVNLLSFVNPLSTANRRLKVSADEVILFVSVTNPNTNTVVADEESIPVQSQGEVE